MPLETKVFAILVGLFNEPIEEAKEGERNILSNPFKRFEDMNMMRHTKTLGIVEVDSTVWKKLSDDEKAHIYRKEIYRAL